MERALVVVEPTDTAKELAYEAGTIAEGVGANLVLTHITTEQEYSARRGAMESLMSSSASYTVGEAEEGATQFASDIGDEVLSDLDVEYEVEGFLGNKAEKILDAADEYNCDHVFLTGRQRSPTGKALFGDATQGVILDFEGPVTVLTG